MPRVIGSYDRLLDDWQALATHMEQVFQFSWPARSLQTEVAIADFLSNELRHHRISATDSRMPEWYDAVYQILDRWAEIGEDHTDHTKLEHIRRELNRAAPNFIPLAKSTIHQSRHVRALEAQASARDNEISTLSQARDALSQKLQAFEAERSAMRLEFTQAQQEATDRIAATEVELQREHKVNCVLRSAGAAQLRQINRLTIQLEEADNTRRLVMAEHQQTARRAHALDASLSAAQLNSIHLQMQRRTVTTELNERIKQVTELLTKLDRLYKINAKAESQIAWLSQVLILIIKHPIGWAAIPKLWQQRKIHKLLYHKGLFDAQSYLTRHSDVAEQRMDPLRHYILYGRAEGRS